MLKPEDTSPSEKIEYATLTVSDQDFCISINDIRETRRWTESTLLPHAPPYVLGVMNLRGIVIPIIDLSEKLGFGAATPSTRHVIIIIERDEQTVGLVADGVQEILSIGKDQIHEPPNMSSANSETCIDGLISRDDNMIRVINVSSILSSLKEIRH